MKNEKMKIADMPVRLTRVEMKKVLGGLDPDEGGGGQCTGNCQYLLSPNSNVWLIGTCVNSTIPMHVGCACEKQDGTSIPGCI